jgi:cell division protease FtsH
MTNSALAKARFDRNDLAFLIAISAVKAALAPIFRAKDKCFFVALVTEDRSRVGDYADAAEIVLGEYQKRRGFEERQHLATGLYESFAKALDRSKDFEVDRNVVVADVNRVDDAMALACDRVIQIPESSTAHVRAAVKALFKSDISEDDASLLARSKWSDLRLVFRRGRTFDVSMAKLRKKDGNIGSVTEEVLSSQGQLRLEGMAGYGEAAKWGMNLARDLEDWRTGRIAWKDVDRGVMLAGPPGVGKTVFARALANTCSVPLITTSFASWQAAGYLNDMLKSMRKSFEEAKKTAPSILFVDEVDSVGRREDARGDNASYHKQVINAFLEQLDGSVERDGVVVVGATNRPWEVDEAILRPGRLERTVEIPLPGPEARVSILRWHSGLEAPVGSRFATETDGWSGAAIEALVRHAKRTARNRDVTLTMELVEGELPQRVALPETALWRVAIHECGHALVGTWLDVGSFESLTIQRSIPINAGTTSAGHVQFTPRLQLKTKQSFLDFIAFTVGGIAAEAVEFDEYSEGSGGAPHADLCRATRVASELVVGRGMDKFLVAEECLDAESLSRARLNPLVWHRVDAILQEQFQRSKDLLGQDHSLLRELATFATATGQLARDDLERIIAGHRKPAPG